MSRPITAEEAARLQQAVLAKTRTVLAGRLPDRHRVVDHKLDRRQRSLVVHLLVGNQITSLRQLSGRLVSFRPHDAFEKTAVKRALSEFGITAQQTALDLDNALDGVATGDVGAVVVVNDGDLRKVRNLQAPNLQLVALPPREPRSSLRETASLVAHHHAVP